MAPRPHPRPAQIVFCVASLVANALIVMSAKVAMLLAGGAGVVGGTLASAAWGHMIQSEVRRAFEESWTDATFRFGDVSFRLTAGDTAVMACAIAAGVLAILGGVLFVLLGAATPTGSSTGIQGGVSASGASGGQAAASSKAGGPAASAPAASDTGTPPDKSRPAAV